MKSPRGIVLACAIGLAFSPGALYFQTAGLFIKPMAVEFGWGRLQLSAAVSIAALATALASPMVGRAVDRFGPRRVILAATATFAAAIVTLGQVPNSLAAYVSMAALIGLTGAGCSPVSYTSILSRWFDARLGTSLAFAIAGLGLGQFLAPLYTNWLMQEVGWRMAYAVIGLIALLITVPNASLLPRDRPSTNGPAERTTSYQEGVSYKDALRMPVFWRLAAIFLLITVVTAACMVHIVPLLTDRGYSRADAASLSALFGIAALVGRLALGMALDYVSAPLLGFLSFAGCAIGVLLISGDFPTLVLRLGMVMVGAALGAEGDLMPFVVRRVFGMRHYGTIYGSLFVAFTFGLMLGPMLLGLSFDRTGNYDLGLKLIVLFGSVAALLWLPGLPAPSPQRHTDHREAHTVR